MEVKLFYHFRQKFWTLNVGYLIFAVGWQDALQQIYLRTSQFYPIALLNGLDQIGNFYPSEFFVVVLVADLSQVDLEPVHFGVDKAIWVCSDFEIHNMGVDLVIGDALVSILVC